MSTTRNIFFAKIYAATLKHYDGEERQRQIKNLQPGQSLRLVRNHAVSGYNTAVKVCLHSGRVLGYLPPEFSDGIAILIDQGKDISAVVKEVRSGRGEEPTECLIEMKVLDMTTVIDEPPTLNQVGSKLGMGIHPWEEESCATPKTTNLNSAPAFPPKATGVTEPGKNSTKGDFIASLIIKLAISVGVLLFVLSFLYFLVIKQPRAANVPEAVNESSYQPIEDSSIIVEEPPASYTEEPAPIIGNNTLNEAKRREIYFRNAKIESDATRESEALYPFPEKVDSTYQQRFIDQMYKQWEYQDRVIAERRVFLYKQYDITENQLFRIMWEGVQKHWPY